MSFNFLNEISIHIIFRKNGRGREEDVKWTGRLAAGQGRSPRPPSPKATSPAAWPLPVDGSYSVTEDAGNHRKAKALKKLPEISRNHEIETDSTVQSTDSQMAFRTSQCV